MCVVGTTQQGTKYLLNWNTRPLQTILLPPEPQDSVFPRKLMFSPLVGWPREDKMARSFSTLYNIPLTTGNPGVKSLRHAIMADNSGQRLLSFLFYKEAQRGNDLLNFTVCLSPQTGLLKHQFPFPRPFWQQQCYGSALAAPS